MPREQTDGAEAVTWKSVVVNGLYQTGMLRAFQSFSRSYEIAADGRHRGRLRRVQQPKYLVLGYHRVGTEGPPLYSTLPRDVFASQMRYLKRNFRVISVRQMVKELGEAEGHDQAAVITFDDGYAGTFTEAYPVLREYSIPASVYLTGGAVESGEVPWYDLIFLRMRRAASPLRLVLNEPRTFEFSGKASRLLAAEKVVMYLRSISDAERRTWCADFERKIPLPADEVRGAMLTWDQIRSMQHGGITFGAHTMSHPAIAQLTPDAAAAEIGQSKRLIEKRLATEVNEFAYPFGKTRDCGTAATPILRELGFAAAMTTITGVNQPGADVYRLRRVVVNNDCSIARFALQLHRLMFHPVDEELSAPTPEYAAAEVRVGA